MKRDPRARFSEPDPPGLPGGRRPRRRELLAACLACFLAAAPGCRGRAEFRAGESRYHEGEFRQAYYHFWRAYRQSSAPIHLASLRRAGRRVAGIERERGRAAESLGDLDAALAAYALALEYDPAWVELEADYVRSRESLLEWMAREEDIERARRRREDHAWEELDALLAAALHPAFPAARREEIAAAAGAAGARVTGPLAAAARSGPWPPAAEAVMALETELLSAIEEMERRLLDEEADAFAEDPRRRQVASWGAVREGLEAHLEEVRAALAAIEPAADALRFHERGRTLERRGDLAPAIEAYDRALDRCAGWSPARAARQEAVTRLSAESHRAAILAVRKKDWAAAIERLDLLLRFDPGHAPARELLEVARREIAALHVAEARQYEDAGLPWNAVIRYYLALDWSRHDASLRNTIRRLEDSLLARTRRRWQVSLRAVDADEERVRRDLWGVGDEALTRLARSVVEGAETLLNDPAGQGWSPGQGGPFPGRPGGKHPGSSRASWRGERAEAGVLAVVIEDFDFSYPRGERSRGVETARYVDSVRLVPNPERAAAVAGAARLRAELGRALELEREAPVHKRALAAKRARLAEARAGAAAAVSRAWIAERAAATAWTEVSYPTERVEVHAELACRYTLQGESRWATATETLKDRIVEGDPARSVPADPDDLPSRAETLRRLGDGLAETLARDAAQVLEAREVRRYEQALARIASRSFDQAVEDLAAFLYGRWSRGLSQDPRCEEAARKLLGLTGCDLPRAWRLLESK